MALKRFFVVLAALLWFSSKGNAQNARPRAVPISTIEDGISAPVTPLEAPPKPLFWAENITQISDLEAYKAAGLNTVVVRLQWLPSDGGEVTAENLAPQKAFALEAAKRGLQIIYALPAAPVGAENAIRIAPDSPAYVQLWSLWAQDAMEAMSDTPNLLGWMLPDDPRGLPIFDDIGFRRYLRANFAAINLLNVRFGSRYSDFDEISALDVADMVGRWRGYGPLGDDFTRDDLVKRHEAAQNPLNSTLAFHPAQLALALFKRDAYRALLTSWVSAIRGFDGNKHLVFSGTLPDYAQCLALPAGVDVALPDLSPTVAENDVVTHNPQAIDIARRGGAFRAIPVLGLRGGSQLPGAAIPELVGGWIETAFARGATGAAFDDWKTLRDSPKLRARVAETLAEPQLGVLSAQTPVNTVAVLLSPLADGATLDVGEGGGKPRGLYGFGDEMVDGEPSNLVWSLRWGTAFGGVDYLSPDDLESAVLERYSTIFAPQMLDCSPQMTARLASYVANGGVLVADLGVGAAQSGGFANRLSPQLAQLFGVVDEFDMRPLSFNLSAAQDHSLLPTWGKLNAMRANLVLTLGDGANGAAFVGPTGFAPSLAGAIPLAIGPQIPQNFGFTKRILRAPLSLNNFGGGQAIFAPFRLWTNWRPGQPGFDGFHGDLMARGATLAVGNENVVPSPVSASLGATFFPEIVNRARAMSFLNHDAPNQAPKLALAETTGAGDWLWSNAIAQLPNTRDAVLTAGRPAPIENADELQTRARPLKLFVALAPGEAATTQMRPISAQNLGGGFVTGQIIEESARSLALNLWPNTAQVIASGDKWAPVPTLPGTLRVTVYSAADGYSFAPGSRHHATLTDYAAPSKNRKTNFATSELSALADANGRLTFEFSGAACHLAITPESAYSSGSALQTKGKRR